MRDARIIASSWCLELSIIKLRFFLGIIEQQESSNRWEAININSPHSARGWDVHSFIPRSKYSRLDPTGWCHCLGKTFWQLQEASPLLDHTLFKIKCTLKYTSESHLAGCHERKIIIHVACYSTRDVATNKARSRSTWEIKNEGTEKPGWLL